MHFEVTLGEVIFNRVPRKGLTKVASAVTPEWGGPSHAEMKWGGWSAGEEDRQVPAGHCMEFGFLSKYNGNPLESFKQKDDMIWLIFLKDHCIKSAVDSGPMPSLKLIFGLLNLRFSLLQHLIPVSLPQWALSLSIPPSLLIHLKASFPNQHGLHTSLAEFPDCTVNSLNKTADSHSL